MRLGCNQRGGGVERGGEGQTEGRAAQSQKEGEHSSRHPSGIVSVEVATKIARFLTHHFLHLCQRRRKRKKPEQVVLNESGEGVKMTLVSPSACFSLELRIAEDLRCRAPKDEDEGAGADSELDESESEAEVGAENLKMTPGTYSYVSTADTAPSGIRECQKTPIRSSEEVRAPCHPSLRRPLI